MEMINMDNLQKKKNKKKTNNLFSMKIIFILTILLISGAMMSTQSIAASSIRLIVDGKDFTTLARDTNISRQHLYRLLSEEGNPRWINLNTIFETLGFQVQLAPKK